MRLLIVPMWTNKSIGNCTTYIFLKNFIRTTVEYDENLFVYLPIPKNVEFDWYEVEHPRVKLVPVDMSTNQVVSMTTLADDIIDEFSDRNGKFFVDAILTTVPPTASQLMSRMCSHRHAHSIKPTMASVVLFGLGIKTVIPDDYKYQQCIGLLSSDLTIWQSDNSYKRVIDYSRRVLSTSSVRKIQESRIDAPLTSIPVERLDGVEQLEKPKDKWVVNYGYSLNSVYKFTDIFEIFDYTFCAGHDLKVLASTSSGSMVFRSEKMADLFQKRYEPYFDFTYRLSQDDFWKRASEAHAFLFLGRTVESSFSVLEQFMLDMVGVFYDSPYVREITYDGYPFIGNNAKEVAAILRHVLDDYFDEKVQEPLRLQKEYIREHFDIDTNAIKMYDAIADHADETRKGRTPSDKIVDFLVDEFKGMDVVEWPEFVKVVKEKSTLKIDLENVKTESRGRSFWRFCMERAGFYDDCQLEQPRFVRSSDA